MSTHTAGPWSLAKKQAHQDFFEIHHPDPAKGASSLVLARVTCRAAWQDEQTANANLISAAPDLLDALRELADDIADRFDMESPSTNPGIKSTVAAARAAIAKATPVIDGGRSEE